MVRNKFTFGKFLRWTLLVVVVAAIIWFVFLKYLEWQEFAYQIEVPTYRLMAEKENLTTLAQILAGVAFLVGLGFAGRIMRIFQKNMKLAEDGKLTDRFLNAIQHLGDQRLETRLGGIYALEQIAISSKTYRKQIANILAAFLRQRSPYRPGDDEKEELGRITIDIQAILTIIGRGEFDHGEDRGDWTVDLSGTFLKGADLSGAKLRRINFQGACLQKANLTGAQLQGASLQKARIEGADLHGANLEAANLNEATLDDANLNEAKFRGAYLLKASLKRANLKRAKFNGACLDEANLVGCRLQEADLMGAHLHGAHLDGAYLKDCDLRKADLQGASIQKAHLEGTDLRGATLMYADLQETSLTIEQLSTVESLYRAENLDDSLMSQVRETRPQLLEKPNKA